MSTAPHPAHSQYRWYHELKQLFVQSLERYRVGEHHPDRHFTDEQKAYLASVGLTPQELFDFAEDHARYDGDPDWETVLLIAAARRDYFLAEMNGQPSSNQPVAMDSLPPKDEKLDGIPWLPRLIKKAEAKLRGEMPADLMYGCGGDRRFFQAHGIHPADFLRRVWAAKDNTQKVLEFVKASKPTGTFTEI